ncbi:MAG: acetyl-CoA carboxylase biotin carboxyl carrier protein subunit [Bacteriovoracaceae bacterium]|nr:acetyl-CoA carboxylase biotin carboxyl carrier protein subunit [Bacteriovoracaceae bacterium]
MRYYLINQDNEEVIFDIAKTEKLGYAFYRFKVENKEYNQFLYIKKLANKFYLSEDNKTWRKVAALELDRTLAHKAQVYKVYHGFKPSGLFSGDSGNLVTQMPGKVVKIQTTVGAEVKKGQTLLILEAMKMENEIKATKDGKIKSINVKEGQALDSGQLLMELE